MKVKDDCCIDLYQVLAKGTKIVEVPTFRSSQRPWSPSRWSLQKLSLWRAGHLGVVPDALEGFHVEDGGYQDIVEIVGVDFPLVLQVRTRLGVAQHTTPPAPAPTAFLRDYEKHPVCFC